MSSIIVKGVSVEFELRTKNGLGLKAKSEPFYALKHIDLQIRDGDRVALLGHNGAGKTTLLKVLSGILPPSKGQVEVDGELRPALTLSLGLMAGASCLENIKLSGMYHGLKGSELENYIDNVCTRADLDRFLFQPVKTLSKGMRSRLVISMALVAKSEILIFDEWIGAVDRHQLEGESTLADAIKAADIFIVASHKLVLIQKYCNRCLILKNGRIIHDLDAKEGVDLYKKMRPTTVGITDLGDEYND